VELLNAPRSGLEVKNRRSSAKDGVPERHRCGKIQKEVRSCMMSAGAARILLRLILLQKASLACVIEQLY